MKNANLRDKFIYFGFCTLHFAFCIEKEVEPLTIKLLSIQDQNLVSLFIDNRGHLLQLFIP